MRLKELLKEAGFTPSDIASFADEQVSGISSDSRTLRQGEIFVAIKGLRHDGTRHIGEALSKGAVLVICEYPVQYQSVLCVDNAREALARLFDAWYGHPGRGLRLIGVTGTNGKTSTATMLFHILQYAGYSCGLIGTVESRLGDTALSVGSDNRLANMTTPDPAQLYRLLAQMRDGGAQYAVMEVTSHALTFSKVAPLRFERAVFTNLSPDHLDLHGDMESYFAEKKKLFRICEGAVISCLSSYGERLADALDIPVWRVDASNVSDVALKGPNGVDFTLCLPDDGELFVQMPVAGEFSVENGALAAMTAVSLGVKKETAAAALSAFGGVRGRMERVTSDKADISVFLDYAHTPDALEKLLRTVRGFCTDKERITVLFGCGGDRDRSKRAQMGRIASRLADLVILTSDNCRGERAEDILRDIRKGVDKEKPHRVIVDRKEAIRFAISTARRGDIVVLAGKGHEEYEIRGRERIDFSERAIAKACLAEREGECHAD